MDGKKNMYRNETGGLGSIVGTKGPGFVGSFTSIESEQHEREGIGRKRETNVRRMK